MIEHSCDVGGCRSEPSECLCGKCFDEKIAEARKEGYEDGLAEGRSEKND